MMALLVTRNIRAIGSNELLFPIMLVERIEIVSYLRHGGIHEHVELFHLENGTKVRASDLLLLEPVDEDLLLALRLEAEILAGNAKESTYKGYRKHHG